MNIKCIPNRDEFGHWLNSVGLVGTGVEVGVYRGQYSNKLLSTWKGKLIGVDRYNGGVEFEIMYDAIARNMAFIDDMRYTLLICDSVDGAKKTQSGFDFVYIDAGHTYKEAIRDMHAWYPKIIRGGIICGHDYGREGGVREAVDRFASFMHGAEIHTTPCSSWWIQKL